MNLDDYIEKFYDDLLAHFDGHMRDFRQFCKECFEQWQESKDDALIDMYY